MLEYISPGAEKHVIFSVCTREVAKSTAGLLCAVTTQSEHCIALIEHGSLVACIDILEGPKGRNLQTKKYLLQTIHHCLLEAEVLGNIEESINRRPKLAVVRKFERNFVERIMGICSTKGAAFLS